MKAAIIFLTCLLFMEGFGLYRSVTRRKRLVTTCKKTEYRCGSGDCINEELLCDGTEDCPDGSDETISCKNIPCPSYSFSCTYGACIDPKLRCNGVSDCRDNSDENGCDRILVKRSPIISDSSGNVLPPNSCFLPQHPEHGKWIALHSSTVQPGDIVEINTVIAFSCDTNYKLVPYVTLSLCLPDWTILPKCLNICPSLVPTEGMSLSCSNNGAAISCDNPTDGTKATIKCKNPGGSNPKPVTTCHDGKWDHPLPDCIARTCPTLKPGKYMNLSCSINGASNSCDDPVEGTVATIKCAENYEDATLVSKKFRYCSDGSWDSPLPNCRPVCGKRPVSEGEELVNGNNTNRTTFPWHLGIYKNNEYICGGSLITPKLVLTAAHCFRSPYSSHTSIETYTVGAGKYYRKYNETRDSFAQFSRVSELIIHKNFNNGEPYLEFDFAVLVLAKSFQLSKYVLPACLDINNIDISTLNDHEGVVMGWGYTNEVERPSDTLHSLEVEYKTTKTCNLPDGFKFFYLPYAKDKLCAGAQGRSVCKGDSGGGLVFQNGSGRYVLRGIISTMPSNGLACNPNQDTLYTSVQYHLRDILQLISKYQE